MSFWKTVGAVLTAQMIGVVLSIIFYGAVFIAFYGK